MSWLFAVKSIDEIKQKGTSGYYAMINAETGFDLLLDKSLDEFRAEGFTILTDRNSPPSSKRTTTRSAATGMKKRRNSTNTPSTSFPRSDGQEAASTSPNHTPRTFTAFIRNGTDASIPPSRERPRHAPRSSNPSSASSNQTNRKENPNENRTHRNPDPRASRLRRR